MRILVTGSSGMLGSDLTAVLSAAGHDVTGLDLNEPRPGAGGPSELIKCSITDETAVKRSIAAAGADVIVHAAAWTDVDGCEKDPERALSVNAGGSANVAAAATEKDTPVIAISTDFVFNGEKRAPYTPEDIPDPLSVYGRSKLEGEKAIMDRLSRYAVVRTSWLYGRNGKNFVDTIVNKARSGEKLKVVDDQVGSPTYTVDLSAAILKLIERGTAGKGGYLFQVSNSGVCSWYEFALAILDYSGSKDADIKPIPSSELLRPARRPLFSAMDNGSFEKETGYRSRHWREALKEYIGK